MNFTSLKDQQPPLIQASQVTGYEEPCFPHAFEGFLITIFLFLLQDMPVGVFAC